MDLTIELKNLWSHLIGGISAPQLGAQEQIKRHRIVRNETQVIDFVAKLRWQFQEWKLESISAEECGDGRNGLPVRILDWFGSSSSPYSLPCYCWPVPLSWPYLYENSRFCVVEWLMKKKGKRAMYEFMHMSVIRVKSG